MKAILDIGKTHVKLQLVDEDNQAHDSYQRKNAPLTGNYPHADIDGIWRWLVSTLQLSPYTSSIQGFSITTHGATAALINASRSDNGLVMPVLDYEYQGIDECSSDYQLYRPDFAHTYSPELPAGLNLGKQLFWLQQRDPANFDSATHILLYPQYWAWRLSGQLAAEVTSLGCHTDMWNPDSHSYSSLVTQCGWTEKMPPLRNAWDCLGTITAAVSELTGLPADCKVRVGLHDSNASFIRYLSKANEAFTVISTGTWTILMQNQGNTDNLNASRDMLANVNIHGDPVCCARFMGGREYERICNHLGGDIRMAVEAEDIQTAIKNQWIVTPDFSEGNGPYGGATPVIVAPIPVPAPTALATLYCALMIDQRLSDLKASGPIYIEGAFLKNPLLCALVAQLRPQQKVMLSSDNTGTVMGAAQLLSMDEPSEVPLTTCIASTFNGLEAYREQWYALIE
ncbi:FGGY-family carbohydrate kinase [Alteromonas mediterranea]|uniref:FGGY-family carbohydrate kinase n=1 Tax=Alteromonas mediterranea TaxID=314275 RepID=UPI00241C0644|nr:FGGY family carbohydrate kinase [Alteromonas mediterranea]